MNYFINLSFNVAVSIYKKTTENSGSFEFVLQNNVNLIHRANIFTGGTQFLKII